MPLCSFGWHVWCVCACVVQVPLHHCKTAQCQQQHTHMTCSTIVNVRDANEWVALQHSLMCLAANVAMPLTCSRTKYHGKGVKKKKSHFPTNTYRRLDTNNNNILQCSAELYTKWHRPTIRPFWTCNSVEADEQLAISRGGWRTELAWNWEQCHNTGVENMIR